MRADIVSVWIIVLGMIVVAAIVPSDPGPRIILAHVPPAQVVTATPANTGCPFVDPSVYYVDKSGVGIVVEPCRTPRVR